MFFRVHPAKAELLLMAGFTVQGEAPMAPRMPGGFNSWYDAADVERGDVKPRCDAARARVFLARPEGMSRHEAKRLVADAICSRARIWG
jgi:hypothetical protein